MRRRENDNDFLKLLSLLKNRRKGFFRNNKEKATCVIFTDFFYLAKLRLYMML